MKRFKPDSRRVGQWTAVCRGRTLPVVSDRAINWGAPKKGGALICSGYMPITPSLEKYDNLCRALLNPENGNLVIVQKDKSDTDGSCDGYVGLFRFKDLRFGPDGEIWFEIVDRAEDDWAGPE